jgi:L-2-hydroxyglutarate oxidase LhgO
MDKNSYDVVIVGGGITGSSTAFFLKSNDAGLKVAVVEMDPTYTRESTALSMANARIQFSLKQNIQILNQLCRSVGGRGGPDSRCEASR